jgi:hypothetical protein
MMQFHKKFGGATKGGGGAWTQSVPPPPQDPPPSPPDLEGNYGRALPSANMGRGQGTGG